MTMRNRGHGGVDVRRASHLVGAFVVYAILAACGGSDAVDGDGDDAVASESAALRGRRTGRPVSARRPRPRPGSGGRPGHGPSCGGAGSGGAASGGAASSGGTTAGGGTVGGDGGPPEPPCPLPADFPLGTYALKGLVVKEASASGIDPAIAHCDSTRLNATLVISASTDPFDPTPHVRIDGLEGRLPTESSFYSPTFLEEDDRFVVQGSCGDSGFCSPDAGGFTFAIDKRTGGIASFTFFYMHHGFEDVDDTNAVAVGYPLCAATQTSPPAWLELPATPPKTPANCFQAAPVPTGCNLVYSYSSSSSPVCPSDPTSCSGVPSCTNVSDGYVATCCEP